MNYLKTGLSLVSNVIAASSRQTVNVSTPYSKNAAFLSSNLPMLSLERLKVSLRSLHERSLRPCVKKEKKSPLDGNPFLKGIVLKTLIKKPKKPNSANRKCVLVRLSNGKELVAYVPGIGHNLQEHNVVLVRGGRLQDTPGVKLKCVRGAYDLPHVIKTDTSIKKK